MGWRPNAENVNHAILPGRASWCQKVDILVSAIPILGMVGTVIPEHDDAPSQSDLIEGPLRSVGQQWANLGDKG